MDISPLFFYFFAVIAVICSLMVVFKTNPVSNALNLVLVFCAFAGIYAVLGAHLIAGLQVLVYTGAIMVLFVFVIMLLRADGISPDAGPGKGMGTRALMGASGAALLMFIFVGVFRSGEFGAPKGAFTTEAIVAAGGNTQVISELMFSSYLLPFELTSVLLLAAIVCVVAIAMREKRKTSGGA